MSHTACVGESKHELPVITSSCKLKEADVVCGVVTCRPVKIKKRRISVMSQVAAQKTETKDFKKLEHI